MIRATSFISEHTAEFVLVPTLKGILQKEFEIVTPIFPWMTREGSKVSKILHRNDKFKIIGMYPRRPKIDLSNKENIFIKINEQIILGAQSGLSLGIPIIAGFPLVKDFWSLGKDPICIWIKLNAQSDEIFQIEYVGDLHLDKDLSQIVFYKERDILNYINDNARLFDIVTAMNMFRKIKKDSGNLEFYSRFTFWGGYKPIYFLLK